MSDVEIVLCRPREGGNVGAACRAMKNMGLSRLSLVAPGPMDERELLARAAGAGDVWRGARLFATLPEALAGCAVAVGTTCRRGKKRKPSMRPRELAAWLAGRPAPDRGPGGAGAALVFGSERAGLDAGEIGCCNLASHIPACRGSPSLNLSHAVQVYAYELFLALGAAEDLPVKGEWAPMGREGADRIVAGITGALAGVGFYKRPGREGQAAFLRDVVCRAGLAEREGRYLLEIFEKAARLGGMGGAGDP